jgi:hypothetical protein
VANGAVAGLVGAVSNYLRALALVGRPDDPADERREVHALAVLDGRTGRVAEARAGYEVAPRLARDYEQLAAVLAGLQFIAFVCLLLHQVIPLISSS